MNKRNDTMPTGELNARERIYLYFDRSTLVPGCKNLPLNDFRKYKSEDPQTKIAQ
jgi:hypothetical protein